MFRTVADVKAFHIACDVPVIDIPAIPPVDRKELRIKLIREEVVNELLPAMENDDLVEIADGIADAIYVLTGAAIEYGIPIAEVFALVQEANMAKVDPHTGKVTKRADGKILKPEGWVTPNGAIAALIAKEGGKAY